jgi:hypothetical protein
MVMMGRGRTQGQVYRGPHSRLHLVCREGLLQGGHTIMAASSHHQAHHHVVGHQQHCSKTATPLIMLCWGVTVLVQAWQIMAHEG